MNMNVNGVTSNTPVYGTTSVAATGAAAEQKASTAATNTTTNKSGVVYEPSKENVSSQKTYKQNTAVIAQLKADAEARTAQLRSLVEKLISGQGKAFGIANDSDIWSFLRKGNFTVDPATKAQAEADIAEDGYWGVEQTSGRILDFAKALTGGDPSKIEEMRKAFQKGFDLATQTWGDKLPDISQRTYEATMKKFDEWASSFENTAE